MKIYYASVDPVVLPEHRPILEKIGSVILINRQKMSEEETIKTLHDAEILIAAPSAIPQITKNTILNLPKLKFITSVTTGVDWIDLNAAKEKGIPVSSCKGANARSVAEHTIGLIIDLHKRITEFDRDVRTKGAFNFIYYQGNEIKDKTLGIIGLGDIGQEVAYMAIALSMKVIGFNRNVKNIDGVTNVAFKELLNKSDIVSIHVPLTDRTRNMITKGEIEQMKTGAILINTAREEIINKTDTIEAIKNKKLGGLGIETNILSPIPSDDPYLQYPNIIVNPHNAFNTQEADKRVKDTWVQNIVAFMNGKPQNVVS